MSKIDLNSPQWYINRELSWLEFNDRVLREGLSPQLPLLERLKFLSIVSTNLDEFFMIRVAGLMQQRSADVRKRDPSGLTPAQQITRISGRAHRMVAEQSEGIREALGALANGGIRVLGPSEWTPQQREFLRRHFDAEILPVLTPLAMEELDPRPPLTGLGLNVALVVSALNAEAGDDHAVKRTIAVVPVPGQFARFLALPAEEGVQLARVEDVIAANSAALFPGCRITATAVFRITRDADVAIQDDEAGDLLHAIEDAVRQRRRRAAVRLEISAGANARIKRWLTAWLEVRREDVYEIDGMVDASALMEIATRRGFDELKVDDWPPQPPMDLAAVGEDDLWTTLGDHDVLLMHPYESFEPVVKLIELAADDPGVLAVKQTLYRTSGDSPIIRALERAAKNGKQVTVLVELKARFDEERNVVWARRLEDAGCHVIYGIAGLKTHGKLLLIVRREGGRIRRYVHLSTGNYNDRTARLYSDVGLMTRDRDYAADTAAFFNLLTGYSEVVGWSKLTIAPTSLRQRIVELVDREIKASTRDRPGLIMAKVNSLEDPGICGALYRASRGGVEVLLNVRGICCLRPGVKRISDNIEVRSIVDRFLEHARVMYFRNGGNEEVYLSSADWMGRNLDKRLETLFPVSDASHRRRLIEVLETSMRDNVKAHRLMPDGTYQRVEREGERVRAQEKFYRDAEAAARSAQHSTLRFRPMTRPEE